MYGVIYMLLNKSNKDVYIGQTTNFQNRMSKYRTLNCKQQPKLYNAIKKNGFEGFEVHILQNCNSRLELDEYEKFYIDLYKSNIYGYNCSEGGENTTKGHKYKRPPFTKEHRENMSRAHVGKVSRPAGFNLTEDHKEKLKISNLYRSKSVICLDLNKIYPSVSEACRELKINKGQLIRHLKGKPHHNAVAGMKFEYI